MMKNRGMILWKNKGRTKKNSILTDDEEQRNDLTEQQRKNQERWSSDWMIECWFLDLHEEEC